MKINSDLGYKPVIYSELTQDEEFWSGCQSSVYAQMTRGKIRENFVDGNGDIGGNVGEICV
ncbi:hypothetical protein CHRY9390_03173 [Chryseobacterium aquaeductus]|uniref:Uncharacterized protein n=1 Tax=Chryseobacterium aquaeductus TaxID=2675056 RepID=A0A9N8MJ93_9FLAO|nr:hypothetical protein CHRY9390_03173 [Chryseobacterium potabilaquae]CAD7816457.1 hypothetical protein CHRY9390_03173 [Chryseobacterium aquaeductus]